MSDPNRTTPAREARASSGIATSPARRGRLVAATALGAVVALGGAAYLTQAAGGEPVAAGSSGALPPADFPEPGIAHVHGLGVDPAGRSWQPVSLRGEADFHALHAAHGSVYGYEAGTGQFMVSPDGGKDWQARSTLALRDFAVSPTDPDSVLATTERGLARSTDGGRTWTVLRAPTLAVLAWHTAGSLYGIAPDGAVHVSADGGTSWTERGSAGGPPEAVTVAAGDGEQVLYVAVSGRGILQSTDGGRTFHTRYAG